jgi:sulfur carrier protein ThiS
MKKRLRNCWRNTVKVRIEKDDRNLEMEFAGSVEELMKKLSVNPEAVLVVKNGEVVTEDAELDDNDDVEFVSVVSGG